jgi:hypothetical protein
MRNSLLLLIPSLSLNMNPENYYLCDAREFEETPNGMSHFIWIYRSPTHEQIGFFDTYPTGDEKSYSEMVAQYGDNAYFPKRHC